MAVYYGRNYSSSYTMGTRLGGGGEGEVYDILGRKDIVAKVYFDAKFTPSAESSNPRQTLKDKIETMLDQPINPYINGVLSVAWPQDILLDAQGKFVGYTMPRVKSKYHIFAASRERERMRLYPTYTWKIAVLIAYNLALAVKVIHKEGVEIGDMNPNNIMIDERGHVTLIDTDSFNITNKRTGKIYKCTVGVSEVLPPELQGKDLSKSSSVFTKNTDNFSLSIHIFNLLMNNCHPFGCSGLNNSHSSSSNNQVERNIVKGICPYVSNSSGEVSPDAPDVMMLPPEIRSLFDRAFSYSASTAVKASTISKRPSAEEWQIALGSLYSGKMHTCNDKSHVYPSGYSKCPWCEVKRAQTVSGTNQATYAFNNSIKGNSSLPVYTVGKTSTAYQTNNVVIRNPKSIACNRAFWFFTILSSLIASIMILNCYDSSAGFWLACIAGGVGVICYNTWWSSFARGGDIGVGDYFLSLLCGIGFAFGSMVAVAILALLWFILKKILFYGLVIIVILAFIGAFNS